MGRFVGITGNIGDAYDLLDFDEKDTVIARSTVRSAKREVNLRALGSSAERSKGVGQDRVQQPPEVGTGTGTYVRTRFVPRAVFFFKLHKQSA